MTKAEEQRANLQRVMEELDDMAKRIYGMADCVQRALDLSYREVPDRPRAKQRRRKLTDEERQYAVVLAGMGISQSDIAGLLRVNQGRISETVRRYHAEARANGHSLVGN